jgi:MoaA/NifB/PqqE/SkfB family radical SAM enzyme
VYCAVSQPTYVGTDMETSDFDQILATLKERNVKSITVNGHGETTTIPGWQHQILGLARAGFPLNIITNFARLLTDEELAAMASIANITVSIDTHRPELLRQIRRRVNVGNILINMTATAAKAMELGLPSPTFCWSCVVTDKVAGHIVDYVRFGLACGVRHYIFLNLTKYPDVEGGISVEHVTALPDDQLEKFSENFGLIQKLVESAGGSIDIASGLPDSVAQELASRRI